MSIHPDKRLAALFGVVCLAFVLSAGYFLWGYCWLSIQTSFADDQTMIFEDMRTQALGSNSAVEVAASLEYVVNYYPSGSKLPTGSILDRIVERCRYTIEREIIAHLAG